jgi:hypothetical protein
MRYCDKTAAGTTSLSDIFGTEVAAKDFALHNFLNALLLQIV